MKTFLIFCVTNAFKNFFKIPEYLIHSLYLADAFCIISSLLKNNSVFILQFLLNFLIFDKILSFLLISRYSPIFKFISLEMFVMYEIWICTQCNQVALHFYWWFLTRSVIYVIVTWNYLKNLWKAKSYLLFLQKVAS